MRFEKYSLVRVVNSERTNYDEVGKIIDYVEHSNKYVVRFESSFTFSYLETDIVLEISDECKRMLEKSHLKQLVDLALDINDADWLKEITKKINDLR